jgi:hypothetical protein
MVVACAAEDAVVAEAAEQRVVSLRSLSAGRCRPAPFNKSFFAVPFIVFAAEFPVLCTPTVGLDGARGPVGVAVVPPPSASGPSTWTLRRSVLLFGFESCSEVTLTEKSGSPAWFTFIS